MNKLQSAVLVAVALCAASLNAQTPTVATNTPQLQPSGSFIDDVSAYFTSFNTNSTTFSSTKGQVWLGSDFVSGVNADASLGLSYAVWKPIEIESVTRVFQGDSTMKSEQIGVGAGLNFYDVKVAAYVDGGYDLAQSKPYLGLAAQVEKAISAHSYAGIRLETDVYSGGKQTGLVSLLAGFTF